MSTGANLIEDVCGPLSYSSSNSTYKTRVLRWINQACMDMAQYDFPELITRNATFTTDGDESYDLSNASYLGSTFMRVVDKSVRIDDRQISSRPKSFIDTADPARDYGTEAWYYIMCSRTDFRLWPAEASGSTVYLDWVKYPTTITDSTVEADVSFEKDWHQVIVEGALKYGYRFIGQLADAANQIALFDDRLRKAFQNSTRVNYTSRGATPIDF